MGPERASGGPGEGLDPATARVRGLAEEMEEARHEAARMRELGLPAVLTTGPPHERGTEYVRNFEATWAHLRGAEEECLRKGRDGPQVLGAIRSAMERLRPYMEGDPECTVEEALRREEADLSRRREP